MSSSNERIVLERTNKAGIEFKGRLLASSTSDPHKIKSRWTEIKLFKSVEGKFITQILGLSNVKGEVTRSTVKIAETPEELTDILGFRALALEIYKQLKIKFTERI